MAKKNCVNCNKEIGMLTFKVNISDGVACQKCLHEAGIGQLENASSYTSNSLIKLINDRIRMISVFDPTKKIGSYLKIDENNACFMAGGNIFKYSNLLSFDLLENGEVITKGGLGRAVAGGLLFGGVGAIVGGVTGGKKSNGICTSMKIKVTLKNAHCSTIYIPFIKVETKTKSFQYKSAQKHAQECLSAFQIIADKFQVETDTTFSSADEIMKFKQLLDSGIITQEEFEEKKKQLLGQ